MLISLIPNISLADKDVYLDCPFLKRLLRTFFINGPQYREVRPINLEKTKCFILEGLYNCISSCCYKNGVDISFFLEWSNNVKVKTNETMSHLANKLCRNNIKIAYDHHM